MLCNDEPDAYILTAAENGYGERIPLAGYPRKGRGTQGVIRDGAQRPAQASS